MLENPASQAVSSAYRPALFNSQFAVTSRGSNLGEVLNTRITPTLLSSYVSFPFEMELHLLFRERSVNSL